MFNNLFDVRKLMKFSFGVQQKPRLTGLGSLAVGPVESPQLELARAGRRFVGGLQIIANGFSPATAIPTAQPNVCLWNGEPDGGKTYAIDFAGFWLVSGTPAAGATLMAGVTRGKITGPTAATGFSTIGLNPSSPTNSRWGSLVTLTVNALNPVYAAILSTFQLAAANLGQGDSPTALPFPLLVPPGYACGFDVLSGAGASPKYGLSLGWGEVEMDLE